MISREAMSDAVECVVRINMFVTNSYQEDINQLREKVCKLEEEKYHLEFKLRLANEYILHVLEQELLF